MGQTIIPLLMRPWAVKMGVSVMEKCLDFCQELIMSNHKFSFNFSIGKDNFNFENKELVNSSLKKKIPQANSGEIPREERQLKKLLKKYLLSLCMTIFNSSVLSVD